VVKLCGITHCTDVTVAWYVLSVVVMAAAVPSDPFNKQLRAFERNSRSAINRLRSILEDARVAAASIHAFKEEADVRDDVPVFANLRCGLWYTGLVTNDALRPAPTCYFKSTDGHYGKWAVSRTRINMHVIDAAVEQGGIVVVDATQHGKVFPDSLSKTIPLWAHCMNAAFCSAPLPPLRDQLPPWVPPSEASAMEAAVAAGVEVLRSSGLRPTQPLTKPLRCRFMARSSAGSVRHGVAPAEGFTPLLLYCASGDATIPSERRGWSYVAGAGDDEESWARGLKPTTFFSNAVYLTEDGIADCVLEGRLDAVVAEAEAAQLAQGDAAGALPIQFDSRVWLGRCPSAVRTDATSTVTVTLHDEKVPTHTVVHSTLSLSLNPRAHRDLEVVQPFIVAFVASRPAGEPIHVVAPTVALGATVAMFVITALGGETWTKASLQQLQQRVSHATGAFPARQHLKQLNRVCLSTPAGGKEDVD
jgi:tRNA A64-2'-O-ribosylphosphate transferase